MNSPQSQKLAVGSIVAIKTYEENNKTNHPTILFKKRIPLFHSPKLKK